MARPIPTAWQFVVISHAPHDSTWYVGPEIYDSEDDARRYAQSLAEQPHNARHTFAIAQVSSRVRLAPRRRQPSPRPAGVAQ